MADEFTGLVSTLAIAETHLEKAIEAGLCGWLQEGEIRKAMERIKAWVDDARVCARVDTIEEWEEYSKREGSLAKEGKRKDYVNDWQKARYRSDPAYAEKAKERARKWREKQKLIKEAVS